MSFLTARDGAAAAVRGPTLGGDDHVMKPFSPDLEMYDDAHIVRRGGEVIDLSPTECKLLQYLLANAGRVLSHPVTARTG